MKRGVFLYYIVPVVAFLLLALCFTTPVRSQITLDSYGAIGDVRSYKYIFGHPSLTVDATQTVSLNTGGARTAVVAIYDATTSSGSILKADSSTHLWLEGRINTAAGADVAWVTLAVRDCNVPAIKTAMITTATDTIHYFGHYMYAVDGIPVIRLGIASNTTGPVTAVINLQ